ncbi:MAG: hypothetical protein LH702_11525 [Phormidesmis sp. CAN_BIN44]|nr:hypothetical protein [Phormidesmis sp. CAN_BIN44]
MSDLEYKSLIDELFSLRLSLLRLKKMISGARDTVEEIEKTRAQIDEVNEKIENLPRRS